MSITDRFKGSLDGASCQILNAAGSAAITAGIGLASTAVGFKPGALIASAGALTLYAMGIGCTFDEGGEGPEGGTYCGLNTGNICLEWEVGNGMLYQEYDGAFSPLGINYAKFLSASCPTNISDEPDSKGYYSHRRVFTYLLVDGATFTKEHILRSPNQNPNQVILKSEQIPINEVPSECTAKPRVEPVETVDGNNCNITVQMMGWGQTPGGTIAPIMLTEPGHVKQKWEDEKMWERENPGPISSYPARQHNQTCSFAPFLSYPGPNGDPIPVPIEPGDDFADALQRLSRQLDEQYQDLAGGLDEIKDKLDDLLDNEDGENPEDPIAIPSGQIVFRAACDKDAEGNLEQMTYPLTGASTRNEALTSIYQLNTTIAGMIQQHLLWKTPICPEEEPELEGDARTISFRSDETSPYGKSRLRKRLRYRSGSGIGLGGVVDHWKDFSFSAGPVRVIHTGHTWGTPSVWAANADEGKRVLRHAAAEAGFDPDQVGRWKVGGSDNPRIGVSGTMRIDTTKGFYWITARDGSDERPIVAAT